MCVCVYIYICKLVFICAGFRVQGLAGLGLGKSRKRKWNNKEHVIGGCTGPPEGVR